MVEAEEDVELVVVDDRGRAGGEGRRIARCESRTPGLLETIVQAAK